MQVIQNAETIEQSGFEPSSYSHDDPLRECLSIITRLNGHPISADALGAGLPLKDNRFTPALFIRSADEQGYSARILKRNLKRIPKLVLPVVLILKEQLACVVTGFSAEGIQVIFPESGFGETTISLVELKKQYSGYCIFTQPQPKTDDRTGEHRYRPPRFWFWGTLLKFRGYYMEALVAAALVNSMALATSLFIMNVYDRVVPNNAMETLTVLAIGVLFAVGFEFLGRGLRGYFIDTAGKKVDLLLAATLFRQAMGIRMEARPQSSGMFAAHLREYESLRDFFTSATLATFSDIPFILLFIWVISLIGGPLFWVPVLALPVIILAGLILQIPLAIIMRRYMRESALRHGVLVEAVEGMETLKSLSAEGSVQRRWENYTALTGTSSAQTRTLSTIMMNFTILVQQIVTIALVVWGVQLAGEGQLTLGALIACVILSGRGLAPLAQLAGLMTRYQQAQASMQVLDGVMRKPLERPPGRNFLHRPELSGAMEFRDLKFTYPEAQTEALKGISLRIAAGERVGILGRVGSGKSTLLKLLLGLYQPSSGSILLDEADLQQIDPADLRNNMSWVGQDVRLFFGTLRENVTLGAPLADDRAILDAAEKSGMSRLVNQHPMGFDMPVGEGGEGLSGGQRQSVAIARALLCNSPILLLDEPSSHMDHSTEQAFNRALASDLEGRTLLLVTHKPSMLNLVDRLIVIEDGQIFADGPKAKVLQALSQPVSQHPTEVT